MSYYQINSRYYNDSMTISGFFSNIIKWRRGLLDIHKSVGLSMLYLWLDSAWSFAVYGCTIRQYSVGKFYKYKFFERKEVFTYRKLFKLIKATNNPEFVKYLEDKELFNTHFSEYVPRKWTTSAKLDDEMFKTLCDSKKGIIAKPLEGTEGNGVFLVSADELQFPKNRSKLYDKLKKGNYIIEEVVIQHPQMVFGNKSVNTIRVMSLMDKNGKVDVIKAVLRAGVSDCVVDNFHQGGCVYEVDIPSGRICSEGMSTTSDNILFHPGTDICMLGYQVPNWDAVVQGCINAHALLPECRYISWDVAITPNGIEMIEGNHNGDYDMFEFVGTNMYWRVLKGYL